MPTPLDPLTSGESLSVLVDFIDRWMADRDRGQRHPSAHYEALYPGFEEAVRAEYLRVSESAGPECAGPADRESPPGLEPDDHWIGPYKLLRIVGEGGQGAVYEASDPRLGRRVAIKVLGGMGSPEALKRFQREAAMLASFDHPNLCTLYEAGHHHGRAFIAMRFVEGRSLAGLLREQKNEGPGPMWLPGIDPSDGHAARTAAIVRLIEEVARALDFAHEKGVVHRDVKPDNVILDENGRPVVLDFGLARELDGGTSMLTFSGDVLGTPGYLAPEHVAGKQGDRRLDVYALGVTLYECLTKRRPFEAATREALFQKILSDSAPDPRQANGAITRDCLAVLETALAKDPDRRYGSAAALADDLAAVAAGKPVSVRRAGATARAWQWARRHRAAAALLATALVALPAIAGLGGYLAARMPDLEFADTKRREQEEEEELLTAFFTLDERNPRDAIPIFEKLTSSPSVGAEAIGGLMLAFFHSKEPAKAIEILDRAGRPDARSPALASLRIRNLEALGAPVPDDVARLAAQAPTDPFDLFILGTDLVTHASVTDRAAYERAYELLTRAVRHPRGRPRYHFSLARALGYLGKTHEAEAREEARLLLEHWPDSPVARQCAGIALHRIDPEAAHKTYAGLGEMMQEPAMKAFLRLTPIMRSRPPAGANPGPASRPAEQPQTRRTPP